MKSRGSRAQGQSELHSKLKTTVTQRDAAFKKREKEEEAKKEEAASDVKGTPHVQKYLCPGPGFRAQVFEVEHFRKAPSFRYSLAPGDGHSFPLTK